MRHDPCCVCEQSPCLHGTNPHVFCYRHSGQALLFPSAYIKNHPNEAFHLWVRAPAKDVPIAPGACQT